MGNFSVRLRPRSSNRASSESNQIYYYSPNKTFFGDYFVLGGERFETDSGDYLFGENSDLNFFACVRPSPYPYLEHLSIPSKKQSIQASKTRSRAFSINVREHRGLHSRKKQNNGPEVLRAKPVCGLQPSHTLKSLLNIRKETLRIVKADISSDGSQASQPINTQEGEEERSAEGRDSDRKNVCMIEKSPTETRDKPDHKEPSLVNNGGGNHDNHLNTASPNITVDSETSTHNNEHNVDDHSQSFLPSCNEPPSGSVESENFIDCPTSPTATATTTSSTSTPGSVSSSSPSSSSSWNTITEKSHDVRNGDPGHKFTPPYRIEFVFDSEVNCSVRIYFLCTREISRNDVMHKSHCKSYESKTYYFQRGSDQRFIQTEDLFEPSMFSDHELSYRPYDDAGNFNTKAVFPIVIHCMAHEGAYPRQSHTLIATIEKSTVDSSYSIKPIKQLLFVDGVQYLLQEIYGFENKRLTRNISTSHSMSTQVRTKSETEHKITHDEINNDLNNSVSGNDYCSDSLFECVICMSEERNTVLLPCRHMSLCDSCARSLRYQANNCPICRAPFRALIHIRSIQKVTSASGQSNCKRKHAKRSSHMPENCCLDGVVAPTPSVQTYKSNRRNAPIKNRWSLETTTLSASTSAKLCASSNNHDEDSSTVSTTLTNKPLSTPVNNAESHSETHTELVSGLTSDEHENQAPEAQASGSVSFSRHARKDVTKRPCAMHQSSTGESATATLNSLLPPGYKYTAFRDSFKQDLNL